MPDPIEAWVDGAELRRMGELLVRPGVAGEAIAPPQGTTSGKREQPEIERASQHLAHARALADRSGVLETPSRTAAPQAAHPAPPLGPGPLLGRLTAYRDWLHNEVGARQFFLLESNGEIIVDEPRHEGLRNLALRLARSAATSGGLEATGGSLRVQVSPEFQLEIIPAETRLGTLVLGLLVTSPLSPAAVKIVADGLQRAISPPATT